MCLIGHQITSGPLSLVAVQGVEDHLFYFTARYGINLCLEAVDEWLDLDSESGLLVKRDHAVAVPVGIDPRVDLATLIHMASEGDL
jgi:hypothetical protein